MTGWCPYKTGTLEEQECHFDGYCSECPHNKSDLISRQAAIQEIKDLPDCQNGYSDTYDKAQIIGVLEGLSPAQSEQCWVPCSEGKPEDYKVVMATVITRCGRVVFPEVRYSEEDGWEWQPGDYWVPISEVIAWQPLPEPYKEGEE